MKKAIAPTRRRRRGVTMMEVLTASGITTLVLFGVVLALLSGTRSWAKGQSQIFADQEAQDSIRKISETLRRAMVVTVAVGGKSLTYQNPTVDDTGAPLVPMQSDGIVHTIRIRSDNDRGNVLELGTGDNVVELCHDIVFTDPVTKKAYVPFTAGAGSVTRQVTVMLVTQTTGSAKEPLTSRARETIFLRNIPSMTQ